jgi:hypothetical protein
MDLLESQIDRVGFNSAVDSMLIFASCTLKKVEETFRMEYEQRVIIKFLHNETIDAQSIGQTLQTQFTEDVYLFRTVQFSIGEVRRGRRDIHDENCMGRPPLDLGDMLFLLCNILSGPA